MDSFRHKNSLNEIQRSIQKKLKQKQKSKDKLQKLSRQNSPRRNINREQFYNKMVDTKLASVHSIQNNKTNFNIKMPFQDRNSTNLNIFTTTKIVQQDQNIKYITLIKLADQAIKYVDRNSRQGNHAVRQYNQAKQEIIRQIKDKVPSQSQKKKNTQNFQNRLQQQTTRLTQQIKMLRKKIQELSVPGLNGKNTDISSIKFQYQKTQQQKNKYKQCLQWIAGDQKVSLFTFLQLQMKQFIQYRQANNGQVKLEDFIQNTNIIRQQRKKLCQRIRYRKKQSNNTNRGSPNTNQ